MPDSLLMFHHLKLNALIHGHANRMDIAEAYTVAAFRYTREHMPCYPATAARILDLPYRVRGNALALDWPTLRERLAHND